MQESHIDSGFIYNEVLTYSDTKMRLNEYLPYFNASLADNAEDFYSLLYTNDSHHITSLVNTYYIAGYGVNTNDILKFNLMDWTSYTTTDMGDSMVPIWSASLGDKYSNKTFFVNGSTNKNAIEIDHTELVKKGAVLSYIIDLINGEINLSENSIISEEVTVQ